MFINYTKKYIFLAVCKTGSTSVQTTLIKNKGDDEVAHTLIKLNEDRYDSFNVPETYTKGHPNLTEALNLNLLTPEQIQEYQIFGVMRDPVDRFLSQAYFGLHLFYGEKVKYDVNKTVIEWFKNREKYYSTLLDDDINEKKHSTHWLLFDGKPINNIILYEEMNDIVYQITGNKTELPNHRSDSRKLEGFIGHR